MKHIQFKNILALVLASFLITSCNESSFLDLSNPNQSTEQNFWRNKADAESALGAAYTPLSWPMYGYYGGMAGWLNLNGRGDDIFTILNEERPIWNVCTFQNSPSTTYNMYGALFTGIQRANVVLRNIDDVPADQITDADRESIRGEALFLRAYQYYLLITDYQQVPLRLIPAEEDVLMKPRAEEAELWAQVEQDLKQAIECELPIKRKSEELGRVERGAALALLGKAYLTQGKYEEAKNEFAKLMTAPYSYDLVANYEDNFKEETEFNEESIFEINYAPLGTAGSWGDEGNASLGYYIPQFIGPVKTGGWFKIMPSAYAVSAFISELRPAGSDTKFDKRMYATFFFNPADYGDVVPNEKWYGDQYDMDDLWSSCHGKMAAGAPLFPIINGQEGRFMLKKYTNYYLGGQDDTMGNNSGNNIRVMRFAEVLLMYAEACTQTGDYTNANLALNQIRDRAGLESKSFSADELMDEIKKQSLLEFVGEGHRFSNLKRWYPNANELRLLLVEHEKQGASNFSAKHYYYPIPTDELITNTGMVQNNPWK